MKKSAKNKNMNSEKLEGNFLKEKGQVSTSSHHKEYLGMDVPKDYFKNSKANILDLIAEKEVKKVVPMFYVRRPFQVAASLVILIGLSIILRLSNSDAIEDISIASNDILIESLFIEDTDMNQFVNDIVVNEIMMEAEVSEQKLENIFINSLFVEDSLIDSYTNKSLLDNIIL
tara:strand:+ start:11 stop:529 length:519 start_codon:yes stop_codon:yes gene_type:complete